MNAEQRAAYIRGWLQGLSREEQWALLDQVMGTEDHMLDATEGSWSIQHPLACRESLLDCPLHKAYVEQARTDDPPTPGRYLAILHENGTLVMLYGQDDRRSRDYYASLPEDHADAATDPPIV